MSSYTEYFLNSPGSVEEYELLEITHPNFTEDYFVVRNCVDGLTVTLEDSSDQFFQHYPLQIKRAVSNDTLDQVFEVQLGDLGEIITREIKAVRAADGFNTRPTVIYRTYRSDDLSEPMEGPIVLEITDLGRNEAGAYFEAKPPEVNMNKTGETYSFERFETLRGFL